MKAKPACIPCYLKQALSAAREVTDDPLRQREVLNEVAKILPSLSLDATPAENSTYALWQAHRLLGRKDPFAEKKRYYNRLALDMYPQLKRMVRTSQDPLEAAVRVAVAGNVIDLGILGAVNVEVALQEVLSQKFAIDHLEVLRQELNSTCYVLYIGDNAGEIVFDKILVEELQDKGIGVTYVVKEAPILNDATMDDALTVGMDEVARVITSGSPKIGIPLDECSEEFHREFKAADLIISKGQGNFETLDEVEANIFFILKAKCEEVAEELGVKLGDIVLVRKTKRDKGERG